MAANLPEVAQIWRQNGDTSVSLGVSYTLTLHGSRRLVLLACSMVTVTIRATTLPEDIPDFSLDTSRSGVQSVRTGSWSSASTWKGRQVPTANHVVRILPSHTVTIDDTSAVAYTVVIDGKLAFAPTVNTRLKVTNLQVMAGEMGMGTPGVLEVGTTAAPIAAGVTAEIVISNSPLGGGVADPLQFGTGIMMFGRVSMHGSVKTPTFVRLATEPRAGQTTLTWPYWRRWLGQCSRRCGCRARRGAGHARAGPGRAVRRRADRRRHAVAVAGLRGPSRCSGKSRSGRAGHDAERERVARGVRPAHPRAATAAALVTALGARLPARRRPRRASRPSGCCASCSSIRWSRRAGSARSNEHAAADLLATVLLKPGVMDPVGPERRRRRPRPGHRRSTPSAPSAATTARRTRRRPTATCSSARCWPTTPSSRSSSGPLHARPPRRSASRTRSSWSTVPLRELDDAGAGEAEPRRAARAEPRRDADDPGALPRAGPRADRRRAGDARPDLERALLAQDAQGPDRVRRPSVIDNLLKETIFGATQEIRQRLGRGRLVRQRLRGQRRRRRVRRRATTSASRSRRTTTPRAIEPYGGANTGLGGVIRDLLGTGLGAKPICNTDVFCFAPPDYAARAAAAGRAAPAAGDEGRRRRRARLRQPHGHPDGQRRGLLRRRATSATRWSSAAPSA